ncbi:MAG: glucose-1-phosphate cytidylyltransferase [Candidatus Ratteibacteria bacterium]|jgi:glucose-1-phosphate cytidylyltransferase
MTPNKNIPVVILAGGLGTRLSEETEAKPKPMVEIGGLPILWHIMKIYDHFGFSDFIIALGYKGHCIKEFFLNYRNFNNDISLSLANGEITVSSERVVENWNIHLVETGVTTMTGGRVKRLQDFLHHKTFMLTYGDGLANINIADLLAFHRKERKIATVTAVRPPARFGEMILHPERSTVEKFTEKPQIGEGWINGGFFLFEPDLFEYLKDADDSSSLEANILERLAEDGQLNAYRHTGFWQCMDTLRDLRLLEGLWKQGTAPWNIWNHGKNRVSR